MAKQQIYCSINNCHYWGQGNHCHAESIMVTSNTLSQNLPSTMDAPMASQIAQTPVSKGIESCCKTFVLEGAYTAFEDGVRKKQHS